MMRRNKGDDLFFRSDGVLPSLHRDMVFAEYIRPILFSCTDENGELYICARCAANGEKVEWLAARTTEERVIDLLENRVTIRDIFPAGNGEVYVLTLRTGERYPTARKTTAARISKELFPSEGYCMEAESGEFDEEIQTLRERICARNDAEDVLETFQDRLAIFQKTVSAEMPIQDIKAASKRIGGNAGNNMRISNMAVSLFSYVKDVMSGQMGLLEESDEQAADDWRNTSFLPRRVTCEVTG